MRTGDEIVADAVERLDDIINFHEAIDPRHATGPVATEAYRVLFREVYELREFLELETGRRILLGPLLSKGARP